MWISWFLTGPPDRACLVDGHLFTAASSFSNRARSSGRTVIQWRLSGAILITLTVTPGGAVIAMVTAS